MKKKILFIILGLILAALIFCGGIYFGKKVPSVTTPPVSESNQSDFYYYFDVSVIDGFGIIKDIDANNSKIILSSQTAEGKTLELKIDKNSRFYRVIKWEPEEGVTKAEPLELKDLKINGQVYFVIRPNLIDKSFTILWLNIKSE